MSADPLMQVSSGVSRKRALVELSPDSKIGNRKGILQIQFLSTKIPDESDIRGNSNQAGEVFKSKMERKAGINPNLVVSVNPTTLPVPSTSEHRPQAHSMS